MMIIASERIPAEALSRLHKIGEILLIPPMKHVYPAISSHPDIFICQTPKGLVVDPVLSGSITDKLLSVKTPVINGRRSAGASYPQTAIYNAVATEDVLMHNLQHTDPAILELYHQNQRLMVQQGYCRCNTVALPNGGFLVSDRGIEKSLLAAGKQVLFVHPGKILLKGFQHGFFGGACGIYKNTVYICGSLAYLDNGDNLAEFAAGFGFNFQELYQGPVIDIGSLFFVE